MAISLSEIWSFGNNWNSDFFDRDSNQLDPRLVPFKRIDDISNYTNNFKILAENLELAEIFSFEIESLTIEKNHFNDLRKLYKDKDLNLMIESLFLNYVFEHNLSNKKIEFINKLSPNRLLIHKNKWTVGNIKALTLLNCANVDINFGVLINENIYFWFENTPIKLFNSNSNQMFIFEWQSIKIFIEISKFADEYDDEKNGIEEVKLLKTNTGNFLFIPLNTILQIEYLGFKEILKTVNINKQFSDLGVQHKFKENGLIIPMGYSNKIFIWLYDDNLYYLNQCKDIYKIFKEKQIKLTIKSLDRFFEINELLPGDFSHINFEYHDDQSTEMWKRSLPRIIDDSDWTNLKFINIYKKSTLSPDEFQFWWMMLRSRGTRFNITSIDLKFSLLSECLIVLSLCSGCPELKSVELKYIEADIQSEDEIIEYAKREFIQKFGPFKTLEICKSEK